MYIFIYTYKKIVRHKIHLYSTSVSREQITPKTSSNISRYLYSRRPVWPVFHQSHFDHQSYVSGIKMAENANFSTEENNECLPNFVVFGENEFLEISDSLDDDDILC